MFNLAFAELRQLKKENGKGSKDRHLESGVQIDLLQVSNLLLFVRIGTKRAA